MLESTGVVVDGDGQKKRMRKPWVSLSESPGASQERVGLVGVGLWHCLFNFRIGGERKADRM